MASWRSSKREPSSADVDAAAQALLERVQKEIQRNEGARPGQGTALAGGWAKIGNRTHELLCTLVAWICEAEGLEPLEELQNIAPSERTLTETSFLTLGRLVRQLSRLSSAQSPRVRRLCADVTQRDSVLKRVTKKRRDKVHEREERAQLTEDLRILRECEALTRRARADIARANAAGR